MARHKNPQANFYLRMAEAEFVIIERSEDWAAIKQLVRDPAIFPHVSDDFYPSPDTWEPTASDDLCYLLARDKEGLFGFGIFLPDTWACWKAHMGFLPRSYGAKAIASFKEMLDWMWAHTPARRIVGEVLSDNRRAIKFATEAGFREYGVNEKSRLKGGAMRDQVCLGISRPD
jgi:hypothetical protein